MGEVLGQAVVQVVAHRDEVEVLVQELRHSIRSELEHAQQNVLRLGALDQLLRRRLQLRRSVHGRELVLAVEKPHGDTEVVLPEEEHVDSRHVADCLHVLDAVFRLHLQCDDDVVVRRASVAKQASFVHRALREVDRARAGLAERVQAARHTVLRLLRVVDVRDQDAVGAEIERLLNPAAVVVACNSHHRLGPARRDGAQHRRHRDRLHRAVLAVDQQPVVAGVRELLRHRRARGVEEDAKFRCACPQCRLKFHTALASCWYLRLVDDGGPSPLS